MTHWIQEREEKAATTVAEIMARTMAETRDDIGCEGYFSPWDIFPAVYGSYGGDFDLCAIEVLTEIRDKEKRRDDLGAEMFREMLCVADLCSYGTSPRVCFSTTAFEKLLPDLIEKWKAYANLHWGDGWELE